MLRCAPLLCAFRAASLAPHLCPQPPGLPWLATLRCTQDTTEATRLEFLPHHFLLGSVGATGVLRYQDTSTGRIVATHRTKQVRCWACKPLLRLSGCR